MQCKELEFKKEISLRSLKGSYLFYGEEAELIIIYKKKMEKLLIDQHAEIIRYDAKEMNFKALLEDAETVSFFGGGRAFFIEFIEITSLSEEDLDYLCTLMDKTDENLTIVLSVIGVFDIKKNTKAKKLLKAADRSGTAVEFERKGREDLKNYAKTLCRKQYCDITLPAANMLAERCGGDLGILKTECEKLCAYCDYSGEITEKEIEIVCTQLIIGDIFRVSKHILNLDSTSALKEIDALLALRQPVIIILANITTAFVELYQAHTARAAGVDSEEATKQLKARFAWRMKNAYRDSGRLNGEVLLSVLELLVKAEQTLKSLPLAERVLLERLVIEMIATLKGEQF